jgi:hypothetical protein
MWHASIFLLALFVRLLRAVFKSRDEPVLENLALRQQAGALKLGKHRPRLRDANRAFWIPLRKTWANWISPLLIVKPERVVDWQRRRFRRHWTKISQQGRSPGRPRVKADIRDLIRQMVRENSWGAPRILSALQKLGFGVSETTVSR